MNAPTKEGTTGAGDAAGRHASLLEALRLVPRPFALYTMALGITDLGAGLARLALPWLLYSLTRSPLVLSLAAFAQMTASWLNPFVGVLADRIERRTAILAANSVRALSWLGIAFLSLHVRSRTPGLWLVPVLALVLLDRTAGNLISQAAAVLRRVLTPPEARMGMNTWQFTVFNVAYYVSPALAGLIIGRAGAIAALFLTALSNVAMLGFDAALPRLPVSRAKTPASFFRELSEGARVLIGERLVLWLAFFGFAYNGLWAGVTAIAVALYRSHLHMGAGTVGGITLLAGAATTLVGMLTPRLHRLVRARTLLVLTLGISGAGMVCMALAPSWPVEAVGLTLLELPASPWMVLAGLIAQERIPAAVYGRVQAFRSLLTMGGTPLGALLGGLFAAGFGLTPAILAMGALTFAAALGLRATPLWTVTWSGGASAAAPEPAAQDTPAPATPT